VLKLIELVVRQPKDYSEMLTKIAIFTFFSCLGAAFLLNHYSPPVSQVLNTWSLEVDVWLLKQLPIGWMIAVLLVTIVACVIKLHDLISDVFRIRERFDLDEFLMPLAKGVGIARSPKLRALLKANRDEQMIANVYKYAGFKDPDIDHQLVLSAFDNWCWYWVILESVTVGCLTSCLLLFTAPRAAGVLAAAMLLMLFLAGLLHRHLRKLAGRQVRAILADDDRSTQIRENLHALQATGTDDQV